MGSDFSPPRARASCTRCHRRKKRCDRALPSCKNCQGARTRCSFQDDDGQSASYPIAYVRSLEEKVKLLEKTANMDEGHRPTTHDSPNLFNNPDINAQLHSSPALDQSAVPQPDTTFGAPASSSHFHQTHASPSFADELKAISLEATAERHLGSSSGLSFARLTQMILRRLTPDKADFVFVSNSNPTAAADAAVAATSPTTFFNLDTPSDLFDASIFQSLSESISTHPVLFGDLFLADVTLQQDPSLVEQLSWPADEAHVQHLVDFYFAHSHTLYPVLSRRQVLGTLDRIRRDPGGLAAQPPQDMFRVWMVLAIGSTTFSTISLAEEAESMVFYNKALQYSEKAMEGDEMAALEVIMLQVSYSFFNQLGPNTWFLVGIAARLALGRGLHTVSTYTNLPVDEQERRKRVFFSIYMMDRVVSITLGRPFAIHDDDIDITPFADAEEEDILPDKIIPKSSLHPTSMAVSLHLLSLRRIASKITHQVYSTRASACTSAAEREGIITSLHQELLEWRRTMPFPLPDLHASVPHLTTTWFDFNYYTHLAMIHRPSPLCPMLDDSRVKTLEMAASMSLRLAFSMYQQRRFAFNWLNFLSLFTSTLSLVYAITAQHDESALMLRETKAVDDLEISVQLFDVYSVKFSAAQKIRGMIAEIYTRCKDMRATAMNNGLALG